MTIRNGTRSGAGLLAGLSLLIAAGCGGGEWAAAERTGAERAAGVQAATQEDAEEREREILLDELPDVVRRAALREAAGAEIREVEEVQTEEGTVYEVEWVQGDDEVEITLTPDGTVIHRVAEPLEEERLEDEDGE